MGLAIKSCGKAHPWCKECSPDISEALSEAMLGNINSIADELDAEQAEALRKDFAGKRSSMEERKQAVRKARDGYYFIRPDAPPPTREMETYQRG